MPGLSRRDFIKLATAAGGLSLLGCGGVERKRAKAKVLVIGGGYGGATAAKYIRLFDRSIDVTLLEPVKRYLSCPGSNEVIAGLHDLNWLGRSQEALAANHGVRLVLARAVAIDPGRRRVQLEPGAKLDYDRLILSPGIDFRWDAITGYDESASEIAPHAWRGGPQTELLRQQLEAMPDGGVVLITAPADPYRCPPGPYERASLIAHYLKRQKPKSKILIVDAKARFSKQALFEQGWSDLYPGMIEWISLGDSGSIEEVIAESRTVLTEFEEYQADVLNVIPPQKAGLLAEKTGLTDRSGWCPVDPRTFASTLVANIHVVGDACIATPMPKSAFAANSQAKVCAAAIVDELNQRPPGAPSLLNNCYSFIDPNYAISITGVYEYSERAKKIVATSTGETPMNADRRREADYARSWQKNIEADTFA
jgi:sulfide dehydrogenase [flavocytochrome c] flavoprotein subunit